MVSAPLISCGAGGTGLGCPSHQKCPCLLEELLFDFSEMLSSIHKYMYI